jgi:hypothetical protein
MVLVPGPHLLNSALDLVNGRIHLGAARLIYATLVIVAIVVGLLLGLALLGTSTLADGMTAMNILLAMSFGLIIPKMLIDFFYDRNRCIP